MQARLFHFLKVKNKVDKSDVWGGVTEIVLKALFAAQDVIPHAVRAPASCSVVPRLLAYSRGLSGFDVNDRYNPACSYFDADPREPCQAHSA